MEIPPHINYVIKNTHRVTVNFTQSVNPKKMAIFMKNQPAYMQLKKAMAISKKASISSWL